MSVTTIAAAVERVKDILRRRPQFGLHDDAPATSRWAGGLRVVSSHAIGTTVSTDLPTELGGTGDQVSPGWLFRAGIASCTATAIAMTAASDGITLTALEVTVSSRSDTRGLLGMTDLDGLDVFPGPGEMRLQVRIAASDATPDALRALVATSDRRSPIASAVRQAIPIDVHIETSGD